MSIQTINAVFILGIVLFNALKTTQHTRVWFFTVLKQYYEFFTQIRRQ